MLNIQYRSANAEEANELAELRVRAMQSSLEAIGRFSPVVARTRFVNNFVPDNTTKVYLADQLVGFFVMLEKPDHIYLDHLYIQPSH